MRKVNRSIQYSFEDKIRKITLESVNLSGLPKEQTNYLTYEDISSMSYNSLYVQLQPLNSLYEEFFNEVFGQVHYLKFSKRKMV